jgi:hypothetical protein
MNVALNKVHAFAVDAAEQRLFAGTLGGALLTVDVDSLAVRTSQWLHSGEIEAVACHPVLPYVATLAGDQSVALLERQGDELRLVHRLRLRDIAAENEYDFDAGASFSQALAFHPRLPRLLTRNTSGALVELEFDGRALVPRWCRGYFRTSEGARDLVYVRYLVGSEHAFATSRSGFVVVDPQRHADVLHAWNPDDQVIHCAEHVEGHEYLLGSDSRRVYRVDLTGAAPPKTGPRIACDSVERIVRCRADGRAFLTGFDGCVREFDPLTLEAKGVLVRLPYQCRWLAALERQPGTLLVQCRNGAIYRLDVSARRVSACLRSAPQALFAGTLRGDEAWIGSEGGLRRLHVGNLASRRVDLNGAGAVRALCLLAGPDEILAAGASGDVLALGGDGTARRVASLGAPVRDLVAGEGSTAYAVCEDGSAHRVDAGSGVLASFHAPEAEPLWSAAWNPQRRLLAVGGREGGHYLLGGDDLAHRATLRGDGAARRLRWFDSDRLLVVRRTTLNAVHIDDGSVETLVQSQAATIEDYAFSHDRRYLAVCNYYRNLRLVHVGTRTLAHEAPVDVDFPSGLLWLPPHAGSSAYPYVLLVFGRSGCVHRFQVHDDRLVNLGVVSAAERVTAAPESEVSFV